MGEKGLSAVEPSVLVPGGGSVSNVDLSVDLAGVRLQNPVMPASGCFGPEVGEFVDLSRLGAVVTKTVFADKRAGNPAHRLTDLPYGVLNSVGIPSPGSEVFRMGLLRAYQASGTNVIVSIGGLVDDEYYRIAEALSQEDIAIFEVNASCPNLEHEGLPIATDPRRVDQLLREIRRRTDRPLIVKLTPHVASIGNVARAAEEAGAAGVVVSNSYAGLAVDLDSRRSLLGAGAGGYTGPAIKPLTVNLVHEAAQAISIPVVGCGGVSSAEDVAEFLIAGATAVQVGTATFTRATALIEIIDHLAPLCVRLGATRAADLIGTLNHQAP